LDAQGDTLDKLLKRRSGVRTMPKKDLPHAHPAGRSAAPKPNVDPKAVEESHAETVSRPGGFRNDPDDPTSPNEAIERSRRKLRR
jgi:hypothetical protein